MPVEIRELVIQAKLKEDAQAAPHPSKDTSKKQTGGCQPKVSVAEKQDLKEEIIEYLKEYFYNERLR